MKKSNDGCNSEYKFSLGEDSGEENQKFAHEFETDHGEKISNNVIRFSRGIESDSDDDVSQEKISIF